EGLADATDQHADGEISRRHLIRVGTPVMRRHDQTWDRLGVAAWHGNSLARSYMKSPDGPAAASRNAAVDSHGHHNFPLQLRPISGVANQSENRFCGGSIGPPLKSSVGAPRCLMHTRP